MSTCSQSASCSMVVLHACPKAAKSAARIEGAMMAGGDILCGGAGQGGEKLRSGTGGRLLRGDEGRREKEV